MPFKIELMEYTYNVYKVTDEHGNEDISVVADSCDSVQICGMKSRIGKPLYFESDGYHLENWCAEKGLTYAHKLVTAEF